MSTLFTCDWCGKTSKGYSDGELYGMPRWVAGSGWVQRVRGRGFLIDFCSHDCQENWGKQESFCFKGIHRINWKQNQLERCMQCDEPLEQKKE